MDPDLALLGEIPTADPGAHQAAAKRIIRRLQSPEILDALIKLLFETPKKPRIKGARPAVHYGVTCDQCRVNPVKGKRWKSLQRYDFDLCETCFAALSAEDKSGYKEMAPRNVQLEIGDTVQARSRTGRFFEGSVSHDYDDGSYLIEWSNGDMPTKVDRGSIRAGGGNSGLLGRRNRAPSPEVLGSILLSSALPENDVTLIRALLADGADVNVRDSQGVTPLVFAVSHGFSEEIITLLLSTRADPNMPGGTPPRQPLQIAASLGSNNVAQLLLEHSADPAGVSFEGCSDSVEAIIKKHIQGGAAEAHQPPPTVKELPTASLESLQSQFASGLLRALFSSYPKLPATAARRSLVAMTYLLHHAPQSITKSLVPVHTPSLLLLTKSLFTTDSLATALLILRIVQGVLRIAPQMSSQLQRHGIMKMATQMSETKFIKQRGLVSESGNTQARDVTELATSVASQLRELSKTHPPVPATKLQEICSGLAIGEQSALIQLQKLLVEDDSVTAFELEENEFPAAFIKYFDVRGQSQSNEQIKQEVREIFAEDSNACGLKLLVDMLQHLVTIYEQLPLYTYGRQSSSQSSLHALTEPLKFHIQLNPAAKEQLDFDDEPEPMAVDECNPSNENDDQDDNQESASQDMALAEMLGVEQPAQASLDPFSAAVAIAMRAVTGSRTNPMESALGLLEGNSTAAPEQEKIGEIRIRAEPLCKLQQLQHHILCTCTIVNKDYLAYCQKLVGAIICSWPRHENDTSKNTTEPERALVLGFRYASPAKIGVHLLRSANGKECEAVLAVRDYVIEKRLPVTEKGVHHPDFPVVDKKQTVPTDAPEARSRIVSITCPEGFPVEMFLDSVKPAVKRALSQPEPGEAPMNRPPGSQYQWPDRGWQRESEFCTVLEETLNSSGSGPVARGQTLREAEVLVTRLASVVVATISVDHSFVMAHNISDSGNSSQQCSLSKGMRVHGVLQGTSSEWLPATVVHAKVSSLSLVYDDGVFEEDVATSRVRVQKSGNSMQRERLLISDEPSLQEFLHRHLSAQSSRGPHSSATGYLQCKYAAFETGAVNHAGHIDLESAELPPHSKQPALLPSEYESPVKLKVQLSIHSGAQPSKELQPQTNLYRALQQLSQPGDIMPITSQHRSRATHTLDYSVEIDSKSSTEQPSAAESRRDDMQKWSCPELAQQFPTCPSTLQLFQVLQLLHLIFRDMSCQQPRWGNLRLTAKLLHQLDDPLTLVSGATPKWFLQLPRLFPFLFSLSARQMQLAACAFCESHSVNWVQARAVRLQRDRLAERRAAAERIAAAAAKDEDMEQLAEAAERLAEVEDEAERDRIGQLKSDIVKVSRENILVTAQKLMAVHAHSEAALEVQFIGEDGFGTGVTQNFYSAVSTALQLRATNVQVPMWVPDCPGTEGYLACTSGLYPMPIKQVGEAKLEAICEHYLLLGRLMAKALRDQFIVPIPVCKHLLAMVLGHQPSQAWLPHISATGGVVTGYAAVIADTIKMKQSTMPSIGDWEFTRKYLKLDYEMTLDKYLVAGGACWVDPLGGTPLEAGGQHRDLVAADLPDFVARVMEWWFKDGVVSQIEAFKQGISEVISITMLEAFSPSELVSLLCGDNSVEWDSNSLNQHLQPTGSMTTASPVFQLLVQYLLQLENSERAAFLNFVTACPRLPPGGVAALNIEIGPSSSQSRIPTSRTCIPRLYLPNYETVDDFKAGFLTAFSNAEAGGFHELGET